MTHPSSEAGDSLPPLLALVQCAALINHVAATGMADVEALSHLVDRLLDEREDGPGRPPDDYRDYPIGLSVLGDILRGELPENLGRVPAYIRALMKLERKLARRPALRAALQDRLRQVRRSQTFFNSNPAAVHAVLASVYADTLGQLNSPLPVTGALRQISDRHNANIIGTLILGGVQAASQWRNRGGRWWWLRLHRGAVVRALEKRQ